MYRQTQLPHLSDSVLVNVRGPEERVVRRPASGRALHVYKLGRADWLVSEVGRDTEGRGPDLRRALAALFAVVRAPEWLNAVATPLNGGELQGFESGKAER
jgi:hypothetical protein